MIYFVILPLGVGSFSLMHAAAEYCEPHVVSICVTHSMSKFRKDRLYSARSSALVTGLLWLFYL